MIKMNRKSYLAPFAAIVMAVCGCQDDSLVRNDVSNGHIIAFDVAMVDSLSEDSIVDFEAGTISLTGVEKSLSLSVSITDIPSSMDSTSEGTITRGTPITTENLGGEYPSFVMNAKEVANSDGFTFSLSDVEVSYNSSLTPKWNTVEWNTSTLKPYYWPVESNNVDFWFYSPKVLTEDLGGVRSKPVVDFAAGTASFTYETTHGATDSGNAVDAVKQPDLLFAHQIWNRDQGTVAVHFNHALSAIRFVAGVTCECVINSISFKNVVTKASCVYAPDDTDNGIFHWTLSSSAGDKNDVKQTFDAPMNSNLDTEVRQGVTDDGNHTERTFMVIPQSYQNVQVVVEYTVGGVTHTAGFTLPEVATQTGHTQEWLPGKMYTYLLNNVGDGLYDFTFNLQNTADSHKVYSNTVSPSETTSIPVVSKRRKIINPTGTEHDWDWKIKSYQIGSTTPVEVTDNSFTDGFFEVKKHGTNLEVTSLSRTDQAVYRGSHDTWINKDGISAGYEDWVPEDWTESYAPESDPLDLSKFDYRTETIGGTMNTANCYIIRHAGTYKIPLVYGNAIKNGVANEIAYYPNANGDVSDPTRTVDDPEDETRTVIGNYRLEHFVNHLGNNITSPFIENHEDCQAASAAIIWQDRENVIKNAEIIGSESTTYDASSVRYLKFTVDNEKASQNNAIIAIKDASNNVIWSWHIWTTNDPSLLDDPIPVTSASSQVYNFFPVYMLGWIEPALYPENEIKVVLSQRRTGDEIEVTVNQKEVRDPSFGTLFQWGRKDPMPTHNVVSGSFSIQSAPASLAALISNPGVFYKSNSPVTTDYRLHDIRYYNLWTGKKSIAAPTNTIVYDMDGTVTKTVYDPSPVGYQTPVSGAFEPFTNTTLGLYIADSSVRGRSVYYTDSSHDSDKTITFPIGGFRQYYNGSLSGSAKGSEDGQYWTAIPGGAYDTKTSHWMKAYYFGGNSAKLTSGYNYQHRGQYVRPIKEQ